MASSLSIAQTRRSDTAQSSFIASALIMTVRRKLLLSAAGLAIAVLLIAASAQMSSHVSAKRDVSVGEQSSQQLGKSVPLAGRPTSPIFAIASLSNGEVQSSDKAAQDRGKIARTHSARSGSRSDSLISDLCSAGEYEQAVRLVVEDKSDDATDRLAMVYRRWSERAPEPAWRSALALEDPGLRFAALEIATHAWSRADPNTLADKAREASPGAERTLALTMTLRAWLDQDLEAAAAWLMRWEPTGALACVDIDLVLEE